MSNSIAQHFENRDAGVRLVYDSILDVAQRFRPVEEDPKKTSIHLNRRSAFAGIRTRKEHLILTVKSPSLIDSERISRSDQASARRWYNEIILRSPSDVDREITEWLRASYEI